MKKDTTNSGSCFHCGDECKEHTYHIEEKKFCCLGCKTVYELLSENDLCEYYKLDESRKVNSADIGEGNQYSFLDKAEIRREIMDYEDDNIARVELDVPVIHCSSCIWLLEKLHTLAPGVVSSQVNFSRKTVYLIYRTKETTLSELCAIMSHVGYPPVIRLDKKENKPSNSEAKKLLLKIGITGFCTGNIMLLSFPEYFHMEGLIDGISDTFFRYLNFALALPVLFYGGSDYITSAYKSIRSNYLNIDVPLSIGILVLFIRSITDIFLLDQSGYLDTMAGLVFFLLLGKWVQQKVYASLSFERDFKSFLPLAAKKLIDGVPTDVLVTELSKGDILEVPHAGLLPIDGILISESSKGDLSFITGEADAIKLSKGDYLYAGTKIVGKSAQVVVQKEVNQGYLSKLWSGSSLNGGKEKEEINSYADRVSKYFVLGTFLIASITAVFWSYVDSSVTWPAVSAVLIVACPCALALAAPFCFSTGMVMLGKRGFYAKTPGTLRRMASIDTAIFDKTGTLTEKGAKEVSFEGVRALSPQERSAIYSVAKQSGHPASEAIVSYLEKGECLLENLLHFQEHEGNGIEGYTKEIAVVLGKAEFVGCTIHQAPVSSSVFVSLNGECVGYFSIKRNYRKGLRNMIAGLGEANIETSVVSGDNNTEEPHLREFFSNNASMTFQAEPHTKKSIVEKLKLQGRKVLMTGDGINDAAALQNADVGLAITESLTAFTPASDAIMMGKSLGKLDKILAYTKKLELGVKIAFGISITYNLFGVSLAVSGLLSPVACAILMPISSITVVAFSTGWAKLMDLKFNI